MNHCGARSRARLLGAVALLTAAACAVVPSPTQSTAPAAARGTGGAVACAAPAALAAGLHTLRAGGNAADAAVATALALAVVHPAAGNLGGGGFAVVRFGETLDSLDFREVAPAAATPTMFLGADGAPKPEASLIGPLAAGVPGSPSGLHELHRRFGRLPWRQVVEPARRLAADGFIVTTRLNREIEGARERLATFPETAAVWLPGGHPPAVGARMTLPGLARTLEAYAAQGPAAITSGPIASAIEASSRVYGGVLSAADLAAYRPEWRVPQRFSAFSWQVASMSLPSSGGIILAQSAALLERLGWAGVGAGSTERPHLLAETWRRAFADRFLLGDPSTTRANARDLLDPAWIARRAAQIDRAQATPSAQVQPWAGTGAPEHSETTHLSVIDGDGNAVALTTTLNASFGCGMMAPEAGFLLNNEMDDFAAAPGKPNLYGLVQGEGNAIARGKRMLSSMSPTIAWKGRAVVVLGSPGGSRIPTATLQVLLAVVVDGLGTDQAVRAPRVHHQWHPDELVAEREALTPDMVADLTRRGHQIRVVPTIGEVHVARRLADGTIEAAADPRGPGAAGVLFLSRP